MSVWLEKQLEALEHVLCNPNEDPIKLSYPLIQTITQNFSEEIGRGGFGVVYLGTLPGGKIAVKKLSSSQDLDDKLFTDEVNFLIRVKHENIVRFIGYCADTQGEMIKFEGRFVLADVRQRILCFEYIPNGSIYDYLKAEPSPDQWHIRYQVIRGICQGLNYLHEELINHLDLKPENVMLDTQWKPKITDFGLSRSFDEGQSRVFTKNIFGTQGYIAPEAIDKGEISYKSDIFSLGIIIIKLLTGRNKYDVENWKKLLDVDGPEAKICIKIAQACLDADQHKRPTIGKIIHELNELQTVIGNMGNDGTSPKRQDTDLTSTQDKKQYISSDDSSLQSGIRHIDEEPVTPSPVSETTSRVHLVIESSKIVPLLENEQTVKLELRGSNNIIDAPAGLDLVLVVDVTSSLQGERMKQLKEAMRWVVEFLGHSDCLSMVACAATTKLCPLRETTGSAQQELLDFIDNHIEATMWGNNIEDGLLTGLRVLADRKVSAGRVSAIILVCDNEENPGNAAEVSLDKVPVYTFGFGGDSQHTVLCAIAANSMGGTFSYINDVFDAPLDLVHAMRQRLYRLCAVIVLDLEVMVAPVGDETMIVKTTAGVGEERYPFKDEGDGSLKVRLGNLNFLEPAEVFVDLRFTSCNVNHTHDFLKVTYTYTSSSSPGRRERFVRLLNVRRTSNVVEEERLRLRLEKLREEEEMGQDEGYTIGIPAGEEELNKRGVLRRLWPWRSRV